MAMRNRKHIQCTGAHKANVNCVEIGHKSGQIMVSGGDDGIVKFWAVGKDQCILSLPGHNSPVHAVAFDHTENVVGTGAFSGVLKIWDLETKKIISTLGGHHASVNCLSFHPSGNVLASGSSNANVKIWDLRRSGCIFTYSGHKKSVNTIKFSPHGSWLVSGSDDSFIKLWDITMGKLFTEFTEHSASVNCIEFHPHELLLVSGSTDRTVKFWDLEKMKMLSSVGGSSSPIRSLVFAPSGLCVYAGVQDFLKVCHWQPPRCLNSLTVGWGSVSDMAFTEQQLIGASFNNSNISSYIVDIQKLPVKFDCLSMKPSLCDAKNSVKVLVQAKSGPDLPMSSVLWPSRSSRDEIISEPVVCTFPSDRLITSLSHSSVICSSKSDENNKLAFIHLRSDTPLCLSSPSSPRRDRKSPPIRQKSFQLSPRPHPVTLCQESSIQSSLKRDNLRRPQTAEKKSDVIRQVSNACQPGATGNRSIFDTCLRDVRHTKTKESTTKSDIASPVDITSLKQDFLTTSITYTTLKPVKPAVAPFSLSSVKPATAATDLSLLLAKPQESLSSTCLTAINALKDLPTAQPDLISFSDDEPPKSRSESAKSALDLGSVTFDNVAPSRSDIFLPLHELNDTKSHDVKLDEDLALSLNMVKPLVSSSQSSSTCDGKLSWSAISSVASSPRSNYSNDANSPKLAVCADSGSPKSGTFHEKSPKLSSASYNATDQSSKSKADPCYECIAKTGENETLTYIGDGHHSFQSLLFNRLQCLRSFSSNYSVNNIKTAFSSAHNANDHVLLHCLINIILTKSSILNLNLCHVLLPILRETIRSTNVKCVCAGMSAVEIIVQKFATIFKSNITSRSPVIGTDLAAAERVDKCNACHRELVSIRTFLKRKHLGIERNELVEFKENELLLALSRAGYR